MEYLLWIMFDITEKEKKIRTEFFLPKSIAWLRQPLCPTAPDSALSNYKKKV